MSLRIGVIGAGNMGTDHVRTLDRQVSGAVVTAVADVDRTRAAEAAAGIPGARAGDDPLALIADPSVDAVLVASVDASHPELILAAVRAGKPVLSEKPLAPTLHACLRLREAVGAKSGLVSLGFMRRFDPGYAQLKAAIATRAVGRPLMLHCVSRGVAAPHGLTTEAAIANSLVHELDVVPWLLGSAVVQVSWQAPTVSSDRRSPLRDPQLVLLRTADGVLTSCETFQNAGYGYDIRCEVVGEAGTMSLAEPARVTTDRNAGGGPGHRAQAYAADWRPRFADAYRLELQAWVDLLTAGRSESRPGAPERVLAGLDDGVRAASVANAVIESLHHDGQPTDVRLLEKRD
jgi:myo-inositol 2-dehydrogenase/D-chiro-inositol 1-dehydrogenase